MQVNADAGQNICSQIPRARRAALAIPENSGECIKCRPADPSSWPREAASLGSFAAVKVKALNTEVYQQGQAPNVWATQC